MVKQMNFDLILTGNSYIEWLDSSLKSVSECEYDLNNVTIIIFINYNELLDSNSDKYLEKITLRYKDFFKDIKLLYLRNSLILEEVISLGIGAGNSDYVCFLGNSLVSKSMLNEIRNAIEQDNQFILGELRCFPFEKPSVFHPLTLDIEWFKGKPFVIKRNLLEILLGGKKTTCFDISKLNVKIRFNGYKMKYLPSAIIYQKKNEFDIIEETNYVIGNLFLCWFQGKITDFFKEYKTFFCLFISRKVANISRLYLFKNFLYHVFKIFSCLKWRFSCKEEKILRKSLLQFSKRIHEKNNYSIKPSQNSPKVSVIIRTCGRPDVLRETLLSLRNQSYKNFEVIVYEDGENISEKMLKTDFPDLDIKYDFSKEKVGRCVIGNKALTIATGKYLNFLDDDDIFLPDHLEVLVCSLENSNYKIAYSSALQTPIKIKLYKPYVYEVMSFDLVYEQPFNRLFLFYENYIPIQCVMFERDIYLKNGGFDKKLDALEDWDLWVRYACENDFLYVNKITSIYRVPYETKKLIKREKQHIEMLQLARQNQNLYYSELKVSDCAIDIQEIIELYLSRYKIRSSIKKFKIVLRKIFKF
jgi:glycosyltransferase involved in cell wall biosynthesis